MKTIPPGSKVPPGKLASSLAAASGGRKSVANEEAGEPMRSPAAERREEKREKIKRR